MKIDDSFTSGRLVHPLRGQPNSVDLFRTLTRLAGGSVSEEVANERLVSDAVGHHDHYLLVLVDGLGSSLSHLSPPGGFLATTDRVGLHSVFPSTTAVALTSLATASWPAEHGLTGWFTYFPEHRRVIAPLLFRERGTDIAAEELGLSLKDIVPVEPVMGSFFRTVRSFLPVEITGGAFAKWSRGATRITPYRSFSHAARLIRRHYRSLAGPTYSYLYVLTVDKYSHAHGTTSEQVAAEVARVDRLLTRLRDSLPRSVRLLVTADHGLVDVPPERHFTFRPADPLAQHLIAGQTGEGTTPVFHVRPGQTDAFVEAFGRHPASEVFTLYPPALLADRGLYGPFGVSEHLSRHLGDFVGIADEPALLEYVSDRPDGSPGTPVPHVGVHGGLRPAEIQVPLHLA